MFILAAIAAAIAIAGSQGEAKTQEEIGKLSKEGGKRDRRIANNRAKVLEQKANLAAAASQRAAIDQRRLGRYIRGQAVAAAAASGVDPSSVSVGSIVGDIDFEAELRALNFRHQGVVEERGLRYEAVLARNAGAYAKYQGRLGQAFAEQRAAQTRLAGFGAGVSSFAGGAGQSGGGYSTQQPQPSYQTENSVANNQTTLYSKYGYG